MPEQSEWQPDTDNSGDYRWHPEYARRAIDSLRPQPYDTSTLADKVAELDAEHDRPERLVSLADQRLYQAKNAGRNCIC